MNSLEITALNPRTAPDAELKARADFTNRVRTESRPEDPPVPCEESIQRTRSMPAFVDVAAWSVRESKSDAVIAAASIDILRLDQNRQVAGFYISVLPEHRRRGVARQLLSHLLPVAQREGRTLLTTMTDERVPGGAAFMERIGGERGIESRVSQLVLADVDCNLLSRWKTSATERAANYRLEWHDGALPESEFEPIRHLTNDIMNAMPRGTMRLQNAQLTAGQMRERERFIAGSGWQTWSLFARETATGEYAGYTVIAFNPNRPYLLEQNATGVLPAHQNRGLGKWLKAAALERVLRELPEARFIRTGNADSNAPMLAINNALGFAPFSATTMWQVETDKVTVYLSGE